MYIKLDQEIINILCCPICKGSLRAIGQGFACKDCATEYLSCNIKQGKLIEKVLDFRIYRPDYCVSKESAKCFDMQEGYQKYYSERGKRDNLDEYLNEIDSVKEIYTDEFHINGRVLDIGGGQGTTRHFLGAERVSLYVSVDPFINIFQDIERQPNLLKAYPCLAKPCNFLACQAENLPFVANTFDWVHMRSVLDHFQDPYLALKEAYRVLKLGGVLLIGSTVYNGKSSLRTKNSDIALQNLASKIFHKIKEEGLKWIVGALIKKIFLRKKWADPHIFRWRYEDLTDLLRATKFMIVKEHWQKPPFTMCVYVGAKKSI